MPALRHVPQSTRWQAVNTPRLSMSWVSCFVSSEADDLQPLDSMKKRTLQTAKLSDILRVQSSGSLVQSCLPRWPLSSPLHLVRWYRHAKECSWRFANPRVSRESFAVRCCAAVRCENKRDVVVDAFLAKIVAHAMCSFARSICGLSWPTRALFGSKPKNEKTQSQRNWKTWALSSLFGPCVFFFFELIFFLGPGG